MALVVTRGDAAPVRLDPDLQEMRWRILEMIELGVHDTRACAHALHVTRANHRAVAQTVLVSQRTIEHVADDLHVTMAMRAEPGAGHDSVLVDDAQRAEAHMRRIPILGKRKTVPGIEPAMLRMAALTCGANLDHGVVFQ